MRAAGDSGFERDPAGIAAHDLNHHDAVVRFGGSVNFIDGVGGGVQRGIEAEGDFGGRNVVVDGLGHTHHIDSFLKELERDFLRAIAADDDERVEPKLVEVRNQPARHIALNLDAIFYETVFERIAAIRGPQNRAAARQDAADVGQSQGTGFPRPDEAIEAILNTGDLPAIFQHRALHRGADDGVQSGTIAATGDDADAAYLFLRRFFLRHRFQSGLH